MVGNVNQRWVQEGAGRWLVVIHKEIERVRVGTCHAQDMAGLPPWPSKSGAKQLSKDNVE
jgi:hypothetical protein